MNYKFTGVIDSNFADCPEGTLYFYRGRKHRPYLITQTADKTRIRHERELSLLGLVVVFLIAVLQIHFSPAIDIWLKAYDIPFDLGFYTTWWAYGLLLLGLYLWRSVRIGAVVMQLPLYENEEV